MKRRQFTSKQKLQIVLEGLSEKISIACPPLFIAERTHIYNLLRIFLRPP